MAAESPGRALAGARPLRDSLYGDLVWSRPGLFQRELRLEAGSELLASLRWEKLFSFEAQAESADGHWTIGRHRKGSQRGQVAVRQADGGAEIAVFHRNWRGKGEVRFAPAVTYGWNYEGFWRPTYFWSQSDERRLISYSSTFGLRDRVEMSVEPAARQVAELPVLVLLGAYVMRVMATERHAH